MSRHRSGPDHPTLWPNLLRTGKWPTIEKRISSLPVLAFFITNESPLRSDRFVTQKIVKAACRIASGENERLRLGNIAIERDWGWAPEYVEAMWLMLQQQEPADYVIATGQTNRLESFVATAFQHVGLDWREYVDIDPTLYRPTELLWGGGNPAKAAQILGWEAQKYMADVVRNMVNAAMA